MKPWDLLPINIEDTNTHPMDCQAMEFYVISRHNPLRTTMKITIYHNPGCSKSRQTLALIRAQGHEPAIVEYLTAPPDTMTLKQVIKMLGITPRELLRNKEEEYKKAALDSPTVSDDTIIQAMLTYPKLIERPIVVVNNKAVMGRPPENVLTILPKQ